LPAVLNARDEEKWLQHDRAIGRIIRSLFTRSENEITITNLNMVFSGYGTGLLVFKGVTGGVAVVKFAGVVQSDHAILEALEQGWHREGKWKDDEWPSKEQRRLTESTKSDSEELYT